VLKETTTRPKHRRTSHFVGLELFDELEGFTDLEARIAALPTRKDRGDAFEVFAEAYLATQKLVGAEQVWPASRGFLRLALFLAAVPLLIGSVQVIKIVHETPRLCATLLVHIFR
jgi:hypothetical protein